MIKKEVKASSFVKNKITIHFSLVIVFALVIFVFCIIGNNDEFIATSGKIEYRPTVIVDAGHGGFDGGAVASDGTVEKNINLQIALTLRDLLKTGGYNVIMTRETDTGTEDDLSKPIQNRKVSDLKNRLKIMNENPDAVFVSIHLNKFTAGTANGAQVFYSKNHEGSEILGQSIQQSFKEMLQPQNERVIKQGTKSTYLLYNAKLPAVIVECGFISNKNELAKLKSADYQKQIAFTIFGGINDYSTLP